jgi:hypothetical protein
MQLSERPQVNFSVERFYLVSVGEYQNVTDIWLFFVAKLKKNKNDRNSLYI